MLKTILGLHDGHNAAAALLDNGRIVAAVQEERLTRTKNQSGIPHRAIRELFSMTGMTSSAIGGVALNGAYMTYDHFDREPLLEHYGQSSSVIAKIKQPLKGTFVDDMYQRGKARQRSQRLAEIGFENGRVAAVDHHTAHASAAYYGSGWPGKVLILTCDGRATAFQGQ